MDFIQAGFHVFYDNLYAPVHHIIVEKKKEKKRNGTRSWPAPLGWKTMVRAQALRLHGPEKQHMSE